MNGKSVRTYQKFKNGVAWLVDWLSKDKKPVWINIETSNSNNPNGEAYQG